MSNPYAPPTVNEPRSREPFLWQIFGYAFITMGVTILIICLNHFRGLPIGLGGIVAVLNLSAGIVMVALSLPAQTASEKRRKRWLLWMIPVLAVLIIGGTFVVHTIRQRNQAQQAQRKAMYQRELAQKAVEQEIQSREQAEFLQMKHSESPAKDE